MNSRSRRPAFFVLFPVLLFSFLGAAAQDTISLVNSTDMVPIGRHVCILRSDSVQSPDTGQVLSYRGFEPFAKDIPVFQETNIHDWIRFAVTNKTGAKSLFLTVETPLLPEMTLYRNANGHLVPIGSGGARFSYFPRQVDDVNYTFNLDLPQEETGQYFLSIVSDRPLVLPMLVGTEAATDQAVDTNVFIIGSYCGILLVIFFYNLFLYFSVADRSYLTYIVYVFFLGMAQVTSSGFAFRYLWPDHPEWNRYIIVFFSSTVCITAIIFATDFLQIRKYTPKVMYAVTYFLLTYLAAILFNLGGYNAVSYKILDVNGILMGVVLIPTSFYIARKGFRAAYFYLVAWSLLFFAIIAYVLKNNGILPSNHFTNYILYIGSSIEAVLLSIALGDKINILKKEKEASQAQALEISQENERLVREQNLLLEAKVHERTVELEESNQSLNNTLENLKATQSQLVESEKMASLGVLTAGIAHEINNPINFVKSNIKPLQMDIRDLWEIIDQYDGLNPHEDVKEQLGRINAYKQQVDVPYIKNEISSLLQGIEDGATRTAEIVRGLRTFSRLDETELKKVSLIEGLDSTLVLLRSSMPNTVQVVRDYESIPLVECYPGKLNQVFMNIMSNAIYAMQKKHSGQAEFLKVGAAMYDPEHVMISIADTGTGMPDSIKEKIFDPFFTTKEIGEGTGLGLAIVFSIIEKHRGKVIVHSTLGAGTEFQIILPIHHQTN